MAILHAFLLGNELERHIEEMQNPHGKRFQILRIRVLGDRGPVGPDPSHRQMLRDANSGPEYADGRLSLRPRGNRKDGVSKGARRTIGAVCTYF